jgi:predicted homoserine dehydrogenase-like protein
MEPLVLFLKVYADHAGVIITNADGDQPGVSMNLYRFVKGIESRPVLCGNIKVTRSLSQPNHTRRLCSSVGQKATMVTSFADGTKISFEQAIVANATGMRG